MKGTDFAAAHVTGLLAAEYIKTRSFDIRTYGTFRKNSYQTINLNLTDNPATYNPTGIVIEEPKTLSEIGQDINNDPLMAEINEILLDLTTEAITTMTGNISLNALETYAAANANDPISVLCYGNDMNYASTVNKYSIISSKMNDIITKYSLKGYIQSSLNTIWSNVNFNIYQSTMTGIDCSSYYNTISDASEDAMLETGGATAVALIGAAGGLVTLGGYGVALGVIHVKYRLALKRAARDYPGCA